jgi:hypothetical protein
MELVSLGCFEERKVEAVFPSIDIDPVGEAVAVCGPLGVTPSIEVESDRQLVRAEGDEEHVAEEIEVDNHVDHD